MQRVIRGISHELYEMIADDLTSRFAECVIQRENELLDVELNDNVIVKCYNDKIGLDLRGRKTIIEEFEFEEFTLK